MKRGHERNKCNRNRREIIDERGREEEGREEKGREERRGEKKEKREEPGLRRCKEEKEKSAKETEKQQPMRDKKNQEFGVLGTKQRKNIKEENIVCKMRPEKWPIYLLFDTAFAVWSSSITLTTEVLVEWWEWKLFGEVLLQR